MSWSYILIFGYLLLLYWLIPRIGLFKDSGINTRYWRSLFLLKVVVGTIYSHYHLRYGGGGDTWTFFRESGIYFQSLGDSVWTYLRLVFGPNGFKPVPEEFLTYTDPSRYWWDSSEYLLIRINTFLRLISGGEYYAHVVIWNLLSILGIVYIYRFFADSLSSGRQLLFALLALTPSILFWGSGMHKEALSFFFIGLILWNLQQIIIGKGNRLARIVLTLIALYLLAVMRIYIAVLLAPALIAFVWVELSKGKSALPKYGLVYFACILLSLIGPYISEKFDIYYRISEMLRITKFYFPGYATLDAPVINADEWWTFYTNIPKAWYNVFFKPSFFDGVSWYRMFAFVETYLIAAVLLFGLVKIKWKQYLKNNRALFALFFGLSLITIIGLVSVNMGAIARYRSVPLVFLIVSVYLGTRKVDSVGQDSH